MIGCHPTILNVYRLARKYSSHSLPVLITGETGTGKELLARYLHVQSPFGRRPFVTVDCGILSREMARSELFGYVRGAFTGAYSTRSGLIEAASGGTLFLDEIGELDANLQLHLLRLIQEGEFRPVGANQSKRVDFRLIAATNRNLRKRVERGEFREDLYFRLCVVHLHIPPLRERRTDIPILIEHFLREIEIQPKRPFTPEAMSILQNYLWPGNVRELINVVSSTQAISEGELVNQEDLPGYLQARQASPDFFDLPYKEARQCCNRKFDREYMHRALVNSGGNVTQAATKSGIGRQYFQVRMSEHGLKASQYRSRKSPEYLNLQPNGIPPE